MTSGAGRAICLVGLSPAPPQAEALAGIAVFTEDDHIDAAGRRLVDELKTRSLVVTRGTRGLSVWNDRGGSCHISAHPVEVYDVAGAGDTVISAMTLSLVSGADVYEAAEIANHAAACVVRHVGVATVPGSRLPSHSLISVEPVDRVRHARGQSVPDWIALRSGRIGAFPDGVAYPRSRADVRGYAR